MRNYTGTYRLQVFIFVTDTDDGGIMFWMIKPQMNCSNYCLQDLTAEIYTRIFTNPDNMKHLSETPVSGESYAASIALRPHNQKELSALYNISRKTLKKWLMPFEDEIGERLGNYYTIPQVKKIFTLLGFPAMFYEEGGG